MAKAKVITRRRWKQHETDFLFENQSMSCDEVAFYLGRTPWGIYERRRRLNLSTSDISWHRVHTKVKDQADLKVRMAYIKSAAIVNSESPKKRNFFSKLRNIMKV